MQLLLLVLVISCASGTQVQVSDVQWLNKIEDLFRVGDTGSITAVLNEFAEKLFNNLGKYAVKHDMDPVVLKPIDESFLLARIVLTNGKIRGISTIQRYKDVVVSYRHSERKLSVVFPIEFSNLSFVYDYHLTVTIFGPQGIVIGAIHDCKVDVELSFDFNTYHVKLEKLTTMESGSIDLTFQGQILDFVINILSQFVSAVLHPMLCAIIEGFVKDAISKIMTNVNSFFDTLGYIKMYAL